MHHYKGKYREAFPTVSRSLLDLDITVSSAVEATAPDEDVVIPSEADMGTGESARLEIVASRTDHLPLRPIVLPPIPIAMNKSDRQEMQPF